MHFLTGIGIVVVFFGSFIILVAFSRYNSLEITLLAAVGFNAVVTGLILVGFGRVVLAAEEIAANTRPLLSLKRPAQAGDAIDSPPRAAGQSSGYVASYDWKGRTVRELSDGTLEVETLAGTKYFRDWEGVKAYIG